MISVLACFAALSVSRLSYRQQFPLPTATVPSGLGIDIHFTDPQPGEMDLLAAGGFKWVRMDITWNKVETQAGRYDFNAYDRLMAQLRSHGIRPMFILCFGNPIYGSGSPHTHEQRDAFVRYAMAAISRYRRQGAIWELWNEPNSEQFWKPAASVDDYILLARDLGQAIRRQEPDEWYVGPATSGIDYGYVQRCLDAGLLDYWDGITVHPYQQSGPPEGVAGQWAPLSQMVDRAKPGGAAPILIDGEWGYSDKYAGLDRELQGQYITRQYLVNMASGVPMSIYYDWRNDGPSLSDAEHNFGAVDLELQPKIAYKAVKSLVSQLDGFTYDKRLEAGSSQEWVMRFRKGGEFRYAGWTANRMGATVELPSSWTTSRSVDPYLAQPQAIDGGRIHWRLTGQPAILSGH